MQTIFRKKLYLSTLLLVVIALIGAGLFQGEALAALGFGGSGTSLAAIDNPAACTVVTGSVTCDLYATTGTLILPDGGTVPTWGYSDTSGDPAQLPGPTIIATEGDLVSITLHNNLAENTALMFPGQAMIPDLTGALANGGSKTYTFTASNPGTYLYEAGLLPNAARQVAMGMYGALVVRPLSGAGQAYDAASAFDIEALVLLSEIDPALNANPAGFDMRDFSPQYRLINGKGYPQTTEIVALAENRVLLRYVNAGIQQHTMGLLGMDQEVIARDANLRPYPQRELAESIGPGRTADAIVTIPLEAGTAGTSRYALYDASLLLHNNGAGFGGMMTFLTVTDGDPPATGPTTGAVSLVPNPTDGSVDVTISATIPGATSAEYFIGTEGIGGSGTSMTGTGADEWTATISVATLSTYPSGDHTIFVHGSDSIWGAFNFAVLHLDKLGPATTGITLAPNPSDGSLIVAVSATGNDSATGNSNIAAAEYFIGTPGGDGSGTPMSVNTAAPIASLDGTIISPTMALLPEGAHTVSVHSMDSFGQWGDFATATLAVDQSGPVTSDITADPNPNNGSTPYSPTIFAVRVDATISDIPSGTPGVNSTIQRAEGFIDTIGNDGEGFPLSPRDGLFNETVEDAYVYIPLSTISTLAEGIHPIWVHGQDASGNWEITTAYVNLVIAKDIPTVTGAAVTPNSTDGTIPVILTADAADGSSNIAMAEWFTGIDPGLGNGTAMDAADGVFNSLTEALTASIDANGWATGDYTLSVRARNAAGTWSATDSTVLTVTEAPPTGPDLRYFSTIGNGAIPGVTTPYDDADVYLWDATLFSRILDGTGVGLPGNADIDGLAFDGGVFYLSFNRNGGTTVPGVGVVQDEDVVQYDPENGEWELFFAGVDVCDNLDASNGRDIDAFDVINGISYFSTVGNASVSGVAGPYDDADIYSAGGGAGCSRVFNASAAGLPGNADIDGLTVVDEDTFFMSFNQDGIIVPVLGTVQDEDVVQYDAGTWSLYFDGTAQGLGSTNSQDLDAIDVQ